MLLLSMVQGMQIDRLLVTVEKLKQRNKLALGLILGLVLGMLTLGCVFLVHVSS